MRVIYMGRDKPAPLAGLEYLVEKKIEVVVVMGSSEKSGDSHGKLLDRARQLGIPVEQEERLYVALEQKKDPHPLEYDLNDIDLVISFLYTKKIKKSLVSLAKIGGINFHPAPLPEFRGLGGYNIAIYENLSYWGVSAHFIEELLDAGDIIKVRNFAIDPKTETAFSLEQKSQSFLLELFKEVIERVNRRHQLPRTPQGKGRYIRREEFESLRKIRPEDTLEEIDRKIRAFWYPPHGGAYIDIQGKEYTLINAELMSEVGERYHQA